MKYLVIISGIVGASLLYLLSSASANTDLFSHNYYVLLVMTGVLALALGGIACLAGLAAAHQTQTKSLRRKTDIAPGHDLFRDCDHARDSGLRGVGAVPQQEH